MIETLIEYITLAIVLSIIGEVISHLSTKSKTIDKKEAMVLYDKANKKLIKIDALSDNYDYLWDTLKLYNIKILNERL